VNAKDDRGGASGLPHNQHDIFGVAPEHERRILLELRELLDATPETKAPSPGRGRSMFGEPAWYADKCAPLSRAVWRGQLTESESSFELAFWHSVMLAEMEREELWRAPRRGRASLRPRRRPLGRWRGWTCGECGGPVGPFTGICAPCHFRGWWWP
jgi:hypothetical protein